MLPPPKSSTPTRSPRSRPSAVRRSAIRCGRLFFAGENAQRNAEQRAHALRELLAVLGAAQRTRRDGKEPHVMPAAARETARARRACAVIGSSPSCPLSPSPSPMRVPTERASSMRGSPARRRRAGARVEFVPIERSRSVAQPCFVESAARRFFRRKWRSAAGTPSAGSHSSVLLGSRRSALRALRREAAARARPRGAVRRDEPRTRDAWPHAASADTRRDASRRRPRWRSPGRRRRAAPSRRTR